MQGGHGSLLVTNYQMSFNWGGKKSINVPHLTVAKVTKRDRATDKRAEDWDESSGSAANPLTHKMGPCPILSPTRCFRVTLHSSHPYETLQPSHPYETLQPPQNSTPLTHKLGPCHTPTLSLRNRCTFL